MEEELWFQCPKCNSVCLEEVLINAVISSTVGNIREEEVDYTSGYEMYDGVVDRYQCAKCSFVVARDPVDLYRTIKENNWILKEA